ncbi:hypothetical protein BDF22DRAFT_686216 [Syncephalis plumigaleata]|nr:hypothetical protein BDF22DRAFT_686216 [Syncephalis plumigaleata]
MGQQQPAEEYATATTTTIQSQFTMDNKDNIVTTLTSVDTTTMTTANGAVSSSSSSPSLSNDNPVAVNKLAIVKSTATTASSSNSMVKAAGLPLLTTYLRFVRQTDGRDKTMKLIQYSLKVLLWRAIKNPRDKVFRQRLSALVKAFSTTRKIIRLGHWLEPYEEILDWLVNIPIQSRQVSNQQLAKSTLKSMPTTVFAKWLWDGVPPVVGFLNDFFDDIYCLCRINCLPKWMEDPSEIWSLRCWFLGIWLDLYGNAMDQLALKRKIKVQQLIVDRLRKDPTEYEHGMQSLQVAEKALAVLYDKQYWLRISCGKFLGDLGFCTYDLFHWQFSDGWPALTGLLSGMLSAHKLWVKTATST